jgi:glyoxylase-like metal-dependent hydrolase (beta-lactamase superfamily II)
MPRHHLKFSLFSAVLLAGAATLAPMPVLAKAAIVKAANPGYYTIMVGTFEVTALSDGTNKLPVDQLLSHTTPEKVKAALAASFLSAPLDSSINAFLVNTGSRLVLIDTGAGTFLGPALGKLQASLRAAGYRPDQVDDVLVTHMHPDHVGGLIDGKVAAFPNAIIHINKKDTDYWLSKANLDAAAENTKMFFQAPQAALAPYIKSGKLEPYEGNIELVPGIRAVALLGHTAGHTGYMVESDGKQMLMWGDVVHVQSIQFADPSVTIAYDSDADAAAPTRIAEFKDAADKGYLVAGPHLPFPGLGHVRAKGGAFEWVPVEYSATVR